MKKIFFIFLFLILSEHISYAENLDKKEIYNQQWNTVINLQRLIDAKLLKEVPNLFSKEKRDKIKLLIDKSPEFFINSWKLDNQIGINYKNKIFQGKGLFIFEDGEWKINEI